MGSITHETVGSKTNASNSVAASVAKSVAMGSFLPLAGNLS